MKGVIVCLMLVVIGQFIIGLWTNAIFGLIAAGVGFLAVKNPSLYNVQQLSCFGFYCLISAIIEIITGAMAVSKIVADLSKWQHVVWLVVYIGAFLVHCVGAYVARQIYKELSPSSGASAMGGAPGQGYTPSTGAQNSGRAAWTDRTSSGFNANEAGPRSVGVGQRGVAAGGNKGFVPFSGEGHSLV
eukprot:g66876.t1